MLSGVRKAAEAYQRSVHNTGDKVLVAQVIVVGMRLLRKAVAAMFHVAICQHTGNSGGVIALRVQSEIV